MAYPYYPNYPMAQQMPYNQPQQAQPQQPQAIQNGGFISVPSIDVAKNWPIAPGNSVSFKDEHAPYVYTKTMGFSQLDTPSFEIYRLIKEDEAPKEEAPEPAAEYATAAEMESLRNTVKHMKNELDSLKAKVQKTATAKRKVENDV